jgi:PBSX family phage terminase large subunit
MALENERSQGVIVASTYRNLNDFIIPMLTEELWDAMGNLGGFQEVVESFNKQSLTVRFVNGSQIYLRSCDRPDDLRGPNLSWFFIDEAAKTPHKVWRIMAARCRVAPERGWITTTPRGRNWVWDEFARKDRKNYQYFVGSTLENKHLSKEYKESLIESYSGSFLAQEVYGEFVGWEGLVYDLRVEKHHMDYSEDNEYKYFVAGVDWGWIDPSVILVAGVGFDGHIHVVDEWYANKTPIETIALEAERLNEIYGIRTFWCDSARPEYIAALRQAGFDSRKGKKELDPGIAVVNNYMNKGLLHIDFNKCPKLVEEMETYHYEEDDAGAILKDRPIDKDNHACDALRYLVYSTSRSGYVGSQRGYR